MIHILRYLAFLFVLFLSVITSLFFFVIHHHWIDFSSLEQYYQGKPSIVLDDEGKEWTRFTYDKRKSVDITMLPEHVIQAFIAAEDHNFFNHPGISLKGIIRSLLINVYHGKIVQGASTITQQLVKLLFTDSRRTLMRKFKDQFLAVLVERQFTKDHILQLYLNNICFGCGIYGIQAASERFWSKPAHELTVDEAALLAGVVKNPSHYCPLLYPLSAQKRRSIVLHSMLQMGFITKTEYELYKNKSLELNIPQIACIAPHLKEHIRIYLEEKVGKKKLYTGGLIIQTTVNSFIQKKAMEIFHEQIKLLRSGKMNCVDGGVITIEGKTGHIKACVGGYDFNASQFNRALQARRQLGSIFKPIIFTIALQQGMNFAQTELDEPIEVVQSNSSWKPRNAIRKFEGEMTLARALAHSNNIIPIKTLLSVGFDPVIALARKCGLPENIQRYPSLGLGCVEGTLKEAVGMFNVFAQNGMYIEPYCIRWVKDEWGTKILNYKPQKYIVISAHEVGQVAKVLAIGMERARKKYKDKEWLATEAIGKTGTTNDSRTCWFVGATPDFTTACYIGNDDNSPLGSNVFAVSTGFPIWKNLHKVLPITKNKFSYDPSLKEIIIHARTGQPCTVNDPEAFTIFV